MDWKGLGAILKETGAGVSMMNANPNIRQRGYERAQDIQSRRDLEAQRMQELQDRQSAAAQKIKMTVLQTSLQALQRPDLTPEQRDMIGGDVRTLMADLGMGEAEANSMLNIPPAASEDVEVGGTIFRKDPATGNYTPVAVDTSRQRTGQNQVLRPGAIMVSPDGKEIARNDNPQWNPNPATSTRQPSFKESVKGEVDDKFASAKTKFEQTGELSDLMSYAQRFFDKRVADGMIGVGEAAKGREVINGTARGLLDFDKQYKKAVDILNKDPEAITAGGAAAKGITSGTANVLGVIGTLLPIEPGFSTALEDWQEELNQVAGDRSQYHSIILNLATMNAIVTGLADGRMSNQDIERSIAEIGGDIRSAGQAKRKLGEMRARLVGALKTRLDMTIENFSGLTEADPAQAPTSRIDELRKKYGR
jgi:hypothetical protein